MLMSEEKSFHYWPYQYDQHMLFHHHAPYPQQSQQDLLISPQMKIADQTTPIGTPNLSTSNSGITTGSTGSSSYFDTVSYYLPTSSSMSTVGATSSSSSTSLNLSAYPQYQNPSLSPHQLQPNNISYSSVPLGQSQSNPSSQMRYTQQQYGPAYNQRPSQYVTDSEKTGSVSTLYSERIASPSIAPSDPPQTISSLATFESQYNQIKNDDQQYSYQYQYQTLQDLPQQTSNLNLSWATLPQQYSSHPSLSTAETDTNKLLRKQQRSRSLPYFKSDMIVSPGGVEFSPRDTEDRSPVQGKIRLKRQKSVSGIGERSLSGAATQLEQLQRDPSLWDLLKSKQKKGGSYKCSHCTELFSSVELFLLHLDKLKLVRSHKCPLKNCPYRIIGLPRKPELKRHCLSQHSETLENLLRRQSFDGSEHGDDGLPGALLDASDSLQPGRNEQLNVCCRDGCGKKFKRKDSLQRHERLVHENQNSRFNQRLRMQRTILGDQDD